MAMPTLQTGFAAEGSRWMRKNPDGTKPTKDRLIGFAGTVDLSGVLTNHEADITIQIDNGAPVKKTFTCNAENESAVTVAEAFAALTTCAFTSFTWSADSVTGRLKGEYAGTGTIIQITGALAAALDFGQGIEHGGNGLEMVKCFDERMMSVTLPKAKKDKEDIDQEGSYGQTKRMTIAERMLGLNPVMTLRDKDYDLLELVQGGTYDRTAKTYKPPLSTRTEMPTFWGEIFVRTYGNGASKVSDNKYIQKYTLNHCTGSEGDLSAEAKQWWSYVYNISNTEYTDETGALKEAYEEGFMTKSEYIALDVLNV